MIEPDWKRMAGVHVQDEGSIGAVWIAHDRRADCIHLYDCCMFRREVWAVIAEGFNARGRWIPIGWEKPQKAMADKLLDRGCNMTVEPYEPSDGVAEVVARDIWERMRSGRFKVDKRLAEWLDEYRTFYRSGTKIDVVSFPLMAATLCACAMFDEWARPERMPGAGRANHPNIPVI